MRLKTKKYSSKLRLLLDKKFVKELFTQRKKQINNNIVQIQRVDVYPFKKFFSSQLSHIAVFYRIHALLKDKTRKNFDVFCSGDNRGVREKAFHIMNFLYENGINTRTTGIPQPLFYIKRFQAYFYKKVKGENLFSIIRKKQDILKDIQKTALLIKKTHNILKKANITAPEYSPTLEFLDPSNILHQYCKKTPNLCKKIFTYYTNTLAHYQKLSPIPKCQLVHGDFHPENIIVPKYEKKIYITDFSESVYGSIYLDLGSFLQQFEYMIRLYRKDFSQKMVHQLQKLFLKTYFQSYIPRHAIRYINFFESWIALRSVIYFLKQHKYIRINELLASVYSLQKRL